GFDIAVVASWRRQCDQHRQNERERCGMNEANAGHPNRKLDCLGIDHRQARSENFGPRSTRLTPALSYLSRAFSRKTLAFHPDARRGACSTLVALKLGPGPGSHLAKRFCRRRGWIGGDDRAPRI